LIRLRLPVPRLDTNNLNNAILVIDSMTSFSRSQLKTSTLDDIAKVIESKVLIRPAAENFPGELFSFAHAQVYARFFSERKVVGEKFANRRPMR